MCTSVFGELARNILKNRSFKLGADWWQHLIHQSERINYYEESKDSVMVFFTVGAYRLGCYHMKIRMTRGF